MHQDDKRGKTRNVIETEDKKENKAGEKVESEMQEKKIKREENKYRFRE